MLQRLLGSVIAVTTTVSMVFAGLFRALPDFQRYRRMSRM